MTVAQGDGMKTLMPVRMGQQFLTAALVPAGNAVEQQDGARRIAQVASPFALHLTV